MTTLEETTRTFEDSKFLRAVDEAAQTTMRVRAEAAFAAFSADDQTSVSSIIHGRQKQQQRSDQDMSTLQALHEEYATINTAYLTYDASLSPRTDLSVLVHSHYGAWPGQPRKPLDFLRPSLTDLSVYDEQALVTPGHVEAILVVFDASVRLLAFRRSNPDAPNMYQGFTVTPSREKVLALMEESGFSVAELEYDLHRKQWIGDVATRLSGLFPEG